MGHGKELTDYERGQRIAFPNDLISDREILCIISRDRNTLGRFLRNIAKGEAQNKSPQIPRNFRIIKKKGYQREIEGPLSPI